jgi:hypothetical protein
MLRVRSLIRRFRRLPQITELVGFSRRTRRRIIHRFGGKVKVEVEVEVKAKVEVKGEVKVEEEVEVEAEAGVRGRGLGAGEESEGRSGTCTARLLRSTLDSIATPCSVKA